MDALNDKRIRAVIFRFGPDNAISATPMIYFFELLEDFGFFRLTPDKLTRMDRYDFVTSEVYTEQHILAVARSHPRWKEIRDLSRR